MPSASIATYFAMRRALVSGFLASWILCSIAYLLVLLSVSKNSRAPSSFYNSNRRSSGTLAALWGS